MWDLPKPGLEPMSPALAGRFSTTAPPGKPLSVGLKYSCLRTSLAVRRLRLRASTSNFQHGVPALDFLTNYKVIFLWDFQCYFPGTVLSPCHLEFLLRQEAEGMTEAEIWCIFLLISASYYSYMQSVTSPIFKNDKITPTLR